MIQGSWWSPERQIGDFESASRSRGSGQRQGHVFRQRRWQGGQGRQRWRQGRFWWKGWRSRWKGWLVSCLLKCNGSVHCNTGLIILCAYDLLN